MSAELPPDPTTSTFNPTAWNAPALTPEEEAVLDANYIRFPITQNAPITFPSDINVATAAVGANDNSAANTSWVQTFWTGVRNTAQSWGGRQTFTDGVLASSIDPTTVGGTLSIGHAATTNNVEVAAMANRSVVLHLGDGNNTTSSGGIHIGNGAGSAGNVQILNGAGSTGTITLGNQVLSPATQTTISLGCPMTPSYLYPIASGKIGEIVTGTVASTLTFTANQILTVATISSLTPGIWIFYGNTLRVGGAGYFTLGFSTTTNSLTGAVYDTTPTVNTGPSQTLTYPITVVASTPYYLVCQSDVGSPYSGVVFTALRIA